MAIYTMQSFMYSLFGLMQCFWDSVMLMYESGTHSFLLLSRIPLYECSIICLPIHPVDDLDSFQF